MKKRILAILLATVLTLSSFAGCSSSTEPDTSSAGDSTSEASGEDEPESETDEPESEDITLTLWSNQQTYTDEVKAHHQLFMDENPNITIEVAIVETVDGSELMTAIASGVGPDVAEVSYPQMDQYIYANAFRDLSPYISASEDSANWNQTMLDMFKVNDKYYGIPYQQYNMFMYYNKAIFEDASLTPPETWEELLSTASALSVPEEQQYGFALNWAQWAEWWFEIFVWSAGGDLTEKGENGELILTFTDPAVIEAAEFYRELKLEGAIQPDMSLTHDPLQADFANGNAAMFIGGSDIVPRLVRDGMDEDDIGVIPIPAGPVGHSISLIGGALYAIPVNDDKTDAEVEAAFKFIEFSMSKESMETRFELSAQQGTPLYIVPARNDMEMSDYFEIPEDIQYTLDTAAEAGHSQLEFYGKGVVGSYVDKAVQEIMTNDSADIEEVFKRYEDEAMQLEVPNFNESLTQDTE